MERREKSNGTGSGGFTWVSRRREHPFTALWLHGPITAQEELPAQWREEPAEGVRDALVIRWVGNTLSTAQQVTLGDRAEG